MKRKLSWLRSTVTGTITGNGGALLLSPDMLIHNLPLPADCQSPANIHLDPSLPQVFFLP